MELKERTMSDQVRVTVAPGASVTVRPHPSGIPQLPALVLTEGECLTISKDRAAELLAERLILDPATGEPVPPPPSPPVQAARPRYEGPTISMGSGPPQPMVGGVVHGPDWAATAQPISSQNRAPVPPPHDCTNGGRVVGDYSGRGNGVTITGSEEITGADGRPWPSY